MKRLTAYALTAAAALATAGTIPSTQMQPLIHIIFPQAAGELSW